MGMPGNGFATMRSYRTDSSVKHERLKPGTVRRIVSYARPYKRDMAWFLGLNALSATIVVAGPLMIQSIIDKGVVPGNLAVVLWLSVGLAVLALLDAALSLAQRWFSARVGEGLIYDLRTQVFDHVQRMPVAFFVRAQTGALVSRLNNDVIGAQRALTTTLSSVVSNVISLVLVLVAMLYLSWPITLIALLLLPVFIIPAKLVGRRLQKISREQMVLDAEMGSLMTERFNVAGAMLAKLYGRPAEESGGFSGRAGRVRDVGVIAAMYGRVIFTALTLVSALATAAIYGVGGALTVSGSMQIGTLVALAALLNRMYGPLTALSNVQVDVMTALVSFDRVFEVLDLEPMVEERPDARPLPAPKAGEPSAPKVEFDHVTFRYPSSEEVSLASLESIARADSAPSREVLHDVSFTAEPGQMIALVGHSGAGKSTMTQLVSRLYDVTDGAVRIGGVDVRDLTLASLAATVGVVTQEAHLFHATIGDNLRYARPDATDAEIWTALSDAQVRDLVEDMPDGLDTVVGDRGYRLSGGEKQRMAIARLLLKAPAVVVLDEATAHLDSESEVAVQKALRTALAGRTSLVIAHRLSTIREADQILVVEDGGIAERGCHEELLARGGLYAELYRTQFARQEDPETTPLG
ncbi:ABC transporter ATP-binding protein [Actinocorallia sp. A-T 12471]|uniref:ABC transporter ATP-binding protein n=1 Tax=Actinocorallia sp. A-T 12471 TaxID=3089813 RepID=UPI0029D3BA2A|nr:ABC transporter ATP-binding protein [Actinocorallia sp. A-T 12471]MDX6740520.1 ABC transporter ATP-binding protein [Actinocorallia sp. A-T 12471]